MSDIEETKALVASTVVFWTGIVPPNVAAQEIAGQFAATRNDLAALRGKARFEDEPAAFLAALLDSREGAK